jgi:ribosomal protein S6
MEIFGKNAQDLSRKHATVFKAEVYGIMACAYEIQMNVRQEKYVSICFDSQAALTAIQTARTSPLV